LVQCLDILSKQAESPAFGKLVGAVMHEVEAGSTLSEALAKHPRAFDTLFVNMVDAGEAGGILDDILIRLATYLEKAEALKRKVKSAMTYPAVVLSVAAGRPSSCSWSSFRHSPRSSRVRRRAAAAHEDRYGDVGLSAGYWWALAGVVIAVITAVKRTTGRGGAA